MRFRSVRRAFFRGMKSLGDKLSEQGMKGLSGDEIHPHSGTYLNLSRVSEIGDGLAQGHVHNTLDLSSLYDQIDVVRLNSASAYEKLLVAQSEALSGSLNNVELSRQYVLGHSLNLADLNQGCDFNSYLPKKQGEGQ